MEIKPFKTTISFKQYIERVKPKLTSSITSYCNTFHKFMDAPRTDYYEDEYFIIGYHNNNINDNILCVLIPTHHNNSSYKIICVDANIINIDVEVVLKSELKDLKYIEQTELFKEDEQGKD